MPGEWRWLGSASVEFVPKGLWPYSTRFTVTVAGGLVALDGARLEKPYAFSFETPRPAVQQVEPRNGWEWLTPTPPIAIVFNQGVADLVHHLHLKVGDEAWPVKVVKESSLADEKREQETGRRHARAAFEERGFKDKRVRYEIVPGRPLPLDKEVTLSIDSGLRGAEGPLEIGTSPTWQFRTYGPMKVDSARACLSTGGCPYGPVVLLTTNLADAKLLRSRLTFVPSVEVDWEHVEAHHPPEWIDVRWPYVVVPGKFKPGVEYRITVASGLRDEFGQEAPEASLSVRTDDLEPSFEVGSPFALLEAEGDGALPVQFANLQTVDVSLWSLTPADMARLIGSRGFIGRGAVPPGQPKSASVDLSGARNVTHTRPLRVRQALGGHRSALFFLRATTPEVPRGGERNVLGQITDLAVHAKLGASSGAVWVTRLSDGKPVAGADVSLYDATGTQKWRGRTDANGLAAVAGLASLGEARYAWQVPFALVAASKDGDTGVTLSSWSGGFGPWAFGVQADWEGNTPRSLGMVVPERGIYRPGDKVYLKGLARYRKLGAIRTPAAASSLSLIHI